MSSLDLQKKFNVANMFVKKIFEYHEENHTEVILSFQQVPGVYYSEVSD